jgi:nitrile hydratase
MSARFKTGDRVFVRRAEPIGHVRTPYYIRGKSGSIERLCGEFPNPEELAFGRSGLPPLPMYRVRFLQTEIWPDYRGRASDSVDVEIYEHWLEPAKQG